MKNGILILLTTFLGVAIPTDAQVSYVVRYSLEHDSQLWLEGNATLGTYRCQTSSVTGVARIQSDDTDGNNTLSVSAASHSSVHVEVRVRMLDCGNGAMNSDMYSAMKADQHPTIEYLLTRADIEKDTVLPGKRLLLKTVGNLSIAGVTKSIRMVVQVVPLTDGRYQITGKKDLSMLEFGIQPPSALFGLIKANEKLTVCFNLIAAPDKNRFASHSATGIEGQ